MDPHPDRPVARAKFQGGGFQRGGGLLRTNFIPFLAPGAYPWFPDGGARGRPNAFPEAAAANHQRAHPLARFFHTPGALVANAVRPGTQDASARGRSWPGRGSGNSASRRGGAIFGGQGRSTADNEDGRGDTSEANAAGDAQYMDATEGIQVCSLACDWNLPLNPMQFDQFQPSSSAATWSAASVTVSSDSRRSSAAATASAASVCAT